MFSIIIILTIFIIKLNTSTDISSVYGCHDVTTIFYESLGCKPTSLGVNNCPDEFDCNHLRPLNRGECFRNGKYYQSGADVPFRKDCHIRCKCSYGNTMCPQYSCPSLKNGCVYVPNNGCGCGEVKCPSTLNHMKMRNAPLENSCSSCISPNWAIDVFKDKCAPLYGTEQCCAQINVCPDSNDKIIKRGKLNGGFCQFGDKLRLSIGDEVLKVDKGIRCECIAPPLLTCFSDRSYEAY